MRSPRVLEYLLAALFPTRCTVCGRYGRTLCSACLSSLTFMRSLTCPGCGINQALGTWCASCQTAAVPGSKTLKGLWVVGSYGNPVLRKTIHALKYDHLTDLAPDLGALLNACLNHFLLPPAWHEVPKTNWVLVPVPLYQRKHRERGFNQAELLANEVSRLSTLPLDPLLKRVRATDSQSSHETHNRFTNVHDAFQTTKPTVNSTVYILVDDVYTSGATMHECARVLLQGGAREVWGLVLAKG